MFRRNVIKESILFLENNHELTKILKRYNQNKSKNRPLYSRKFLSCYVKRYQNVLGEITPFLENKKIKEAYEIYLITRQLHDDLHDLLRDKIERKITPWLYDPKGTYQSVKMIITYVKTLKLPPTQRAILLFYLYYLKALGFLYNLIAQKEKV